MIYISMLISVLTGIGLLLSSFRDNLKGRKATVKPVYIISGIAIVVSGALAVAGAVCYETENLLFELMDGIAIYIKVDGISRIFVTVTTIVWIAVTFYSFNYIHHEGGDKRFYGCFMLVYGVLTALDCAGNLVTFYFFYELMTITSLPLVIHTLKRDAIMAALKYLFYSMAGAYMALFGLFVLNQYCTTLDFTAKGTLDMSLVGENTQIVLIAVFLMLIGFGVKAGMFPLHAWLPTAHPAAPAPASAALSAIIVKAGVLGIIRTVFYVVGADFIRGTWVQKIWILLTLLTVFMGSMLAYREKVFKKRLAYSTVSQVSYILFGLALLDKVAFSGALLQLIAHAFAKCALFMTAGIFILRTGKIKVDEYEGIGRTMKYTLLGYTIAALSLIGIPPTAGFVSKWYLAEGALASGTGAAVIGPIVLLVSALLTAGYLLPIVMKGFFPGNACKVEDKKEKIDMMTAFMVLIALFALLFGIYPTPVIEYIRSIAGILL